MDAYFLVQKASLNGEWKTVYKTLVENEARDVYQKQLKVYSIGKFRLVDPNGKVLELDTIRPLFSGV